MIGENKRVLTRLETCEDKVRTALSATHAKCGCEQLYLDHAKTEFEMQDLREQLKKVCSLSDLVWPAGVEGVHASAGVHHACVRCRCIVPSLTAALRVPCS